MPTLFRTLPLLGLVACKPTLPPERPCDEAVYAVASRTFACTGDEQFAEERALALREAYTCDAEEAADTDALVAQYQCAADLLALSCEVVEANGDEPGWWVGISSACQAIFDGEFIEPEDTAPPPFVPSCDEPDLVALTDSAATATVRYEPENYTDIDALNTVVGDRDTDVDIPITVRFERPGRLYVSGRVENGYALTLARSSDGTCAGLSQSGNLTEEAYYLLEVYPYQVKKAPMDLLLVLQREEDEGGWIELTVELREE